MRKIVFCILAFALCLSLCACDRGQSAYPMPYISNGGSKPETVPTFAPESDALIGTWTTKTPQWEATFTFTDETGKLTGSCQYYNYSNSSWGDYQFTVKEKTDYNIILLIDDGSMQDMAYTLSAPYLYLDGGLYVNAETEMPSFVSFKPFAMLFNGQNYPIYNNLFMGMYLADVEAAIGQTLTLEENSPGGNYAYSFNCDYSATEFISDINYYCLTFGFDENKRLVHFCAQGNYNESLISSLLTSFNTDFGTSAHSDYTLSNGITLDTHLWAYEDCKIELECTTHADENVPAYFTVTYFYDPQTP